jgi:peptidoglycan/xylan/chitin deacetylase (PgdA/CDA1 family)
MGTQTRVTKTGISPIDLTGKVIKVVFMVGNSTRLPTSTGQLYFGFSSDNFSSNYFYLYVKAAYTAFHQGPGGTWITTSLTQSDAYVSGTPNLAAINSVRIYVRDGATGPLNVWVQELSYFTPALDYGIVSFTFDDGSASAYSLALPKLSQYGYPATAYISRDNIGKPGGWMTLADLTALQNTHGWDIAAHGSIDLSTLNATDCEAEIQAMKDYLANNGFNGGDYLAYPKGNLNTNIVLPLVQEYFTNARLSGSEVHESFPPGNEYALYAYHVSATTTPATIAREVEAAIANHDWLILVFHDIVASGASGTLQYNVADFDTVVDNIHNIQSEGTEVIAVKSISQTEVNPAPLTITSVTPSNGAQGQTLSSLTITGTYLTGVTAVSFGSGITVNSFTVNSPTQITGNITIDALADTGARDVLVTTPAGTATMTGGFTVNAAPPAISSVNPSSGIQGQILSSVTITGTYLTGATEVGFGSGITVNSFTVDSPTRITCNITIDALADTGARDVLVPTPAGTATKTGGFTVVQAPPTISSVSPNSGIQGQTLSSVTISGTYLTGATEVGFGSGITVNSFTVDSPTRITCNITIDALADIGARDVSVTTPGGTDTMTGGFTVVQAPPTISSVSPNSGIQGQTLNSVTITGTYLTGATSVSFASGITVNRFTVNSSTRITASITISGSSTTGARAVSVTTPGGTGTMTGGFTVNAAPPTISSASPNSGIQGQTLNSVTITGTYLTGATSVSFGSGIAVNSFIVNSSTRITASITISGSATTGARAVSVTTPVRTATKTGGFTVNAAPPAISTVSPNSGIQGQTLNSVTITGTYLTRATSVSFGSKITVNRLIVNSPTQITASITIAAKAALGPRNVSVKTSGGTATLTNGFTVR